MPGSVPAHFVYINHQLVRAGRDAGPHRVLRWADIRLRENFREPLSLGPNSGSYGFVGGAALSGSGALTPSFGLTTFCSNCFIASLTSPNSL